MGPEPRASASPSYHMHSRRTLIMLISKRTDSEFAPIISNTSRSTSPVGNGVNVGFGVCGAGRGTAPKSLGIGGNTLLLVGECDRDVWGSSNKGDATVVIVPFASACFDPSASTVCAVDDTLKNDEDPLLGVALSADGRVGSSLSLSFSGVVNSGSLSLILSRSRDLTPNESLDAFLTSERGVLPVSLEPEEPRRRWLLGRDCALSGTDEISIEGI